MSVVMVASVRLLAGSCLAVAAVLAILHPVTAAIGPTVMASVFVQPTRMSARNGGGRRKKSPDRDCREHDRNTLFHSLPYVMFRPITPYRSIRGGT